MKRFFIFAILTSFAVSFFGCYNDEDVSSSSSEEVAQSSLESEVSSKEVSVFVPEKKYTFLTSKYVVSTKKRFHEVTYGYRYYLVKGRVNGATMTATLPDDKTAGEYYSETLKDFPDAIRQGTSVTVFLQGKKLRQYNNCSYEKLTFLLETEGFKYSANFDVEDFQERYSGVIND